ncbi:MAG TPA: hypothetical protein VGR32_01865 [Brevundimonas sp.]|jgi:ElaB/YqjD/DUF883 family membrane-anchored ribosome-binding protein|uniref:hypothetical protein n=1 Tax=Brevundimonas sp. TaxID=1871086 RepID=UPI002DEA1DE1|nr:hypothetical protein [Brevundimonas sp.]
MTDATRFDETDTTLIPAGEGQYGTVDDGLQLDPASPTAERASLRQTVKSDLSGARDWGRGRAVAARQAVVEDPLRSAFTALGIGVVIGVLLRR